MINVDSLKSDIKLKPYSFICKFAEDISPFTGGKCFEILALVPGSLLIDDLPYMSKTIRSNINVLLLTLSGGNKSSTCSQFAKFTYNPLQTKSITPAELENKVLESPVFSLIVEDYSTMASDERIQKIVDGILGDEKILDRHTTTKDIRENVNGVGLLCGVPNDINNKLTSGNIFRTVCIAIMHNNDQHSQIGRHINKGIGENGDYSLREEVIIDYYKTLQIIQSGELVCDKLFPVKSFNIPDAFKERLVNLWDKLTISFRKNAPYNWFRELHEGYRFLINHAFLNYFNRKIVDGVLYVQEEDCKVAEILMEKTMITKYSILMSEELSGSIRSMKDFEKVMKDPKIPQLTKDFIPVHLQRNKLR